jgi:thioredoxin 1
MASQDVLVLEDATFDQEVLKSDTPVLVDFWATWCGPCKAIASAVDDIAKEYKGKLKVGKLDIDSHQQVPQKYGIRSIPTLLVFKGGRVVDTIVGAVPKSKVVDAVNKVVGTSV